MIDVFISYSRVDSATADLVHRKLENGGLIVWRDTKNLAPGALFTPEIESVVRRAAVSLILWSRDSTTSEWVIKEAKSALLVGRTLPVSLDGALPPPPLSDQHMYLLNLKDTEPGSSLDELTSLIQERAKYFNSNRPRVLWSDDSPKNNAIEVSELEMLGVEVECVRSSVAALAALKRRRYSAVVSDLGQFSTPKYDRDASQGAQRQC